MKRIVVFVLLSTVFFISLSAQTSVVGRVEAEFVVPVSATDQFSTGKFQLSGMPESLVSMVLPQLPQKLYMSSGNQTLTVDKFNSDVPAGG